jgi:hypothetical protein
MKKLIPTVVVVLSCISLIGCGNAGQDIVGEDSGNTKVQEQRGTSLVARKEQKDQEEYFSESRNQENVNNREGSKGLILRDRENNKNTKKGGKKQPKIGRVTQLVNGDLMCYVTLVDRKGIEYNVGATFEICGQERKFLNKKVRVVYQMQSVSDCESAEPCGKTRKESIITEMKVVSEDSEKKLPSGNSQTFSNGEWTITLGNTDSWNGINGTGNVSYRGCDTSGKCLNLTGGKVSCRDGKCVTGWKNGNYVYILEQPMTEEGNVAATLTVKEDTTEVLKATGLKVVSGN